MISVRLFGRDHDGELVADDLDPEFAALISVGVKQCAGPNLVVWSGSVGRCFPEADV
ncbi:hypothetical protein GCM10011609_87970 [Lentzea pudingi]|uniref:Uncharacterized protein n=1 Tax=Lentzea pudingi TaxID=1789439 RepID=A0ABQ2IWX2_9PSEU|nr:hypothetical protein GCM10011609_87970 [Lentzea pudingi]